MMLNSDTMELDLPPTHSETESGFSDCGGGAGPDGAGPGGGQARVLEPGEPGRKDLQHLSREERRRRRRATAKYRTAHATRERIRVEAFNLAFAELRKLLPTLPPDKKLSKIEIDPAPGHLLHLLPEPRAGRLNTACLPPWIHSSPRGFAGVPPRRSLLRTASPP